MRRWKGDGKPSGTRLLSTPIKRNLGQKEGRKTGGGQGGDREGDEKVAMGRQLVSARKSLGEKYGQAGDVCRGRRLCIIISSDRAFLRGSPLPFTCFLRHHPFPNSSIHRLPYLYFAHRLLPGNWLPSTTFSPVSRLPPLVSISVGQVHQNLFLHK